MINTYLAMAGLILAAVAIAVVAVVPAIIQCLEMGRAGRPPDRS